jgi:hypothetical protein
MSITLPNGNRHEQLVKSNFDANRTANAIERLIQTQIAKHLSRAQ